MVNYYSCKGWISNNFSLLSKKNVLKFSQEDQSLPSVWNFRRLLAGEKLRLEMKGIEYMNDDPGEVDVLYGQVNALSWSHSLQTIADSLVDEFVKAGKVSCFCKIFGFLY